MFAVGFKPIKHAHNKTYVLEQSIHSQPNKNHARKLTSKCFRFSDGFMFPLISAATHI